MNNIEMRHMPCGIHYFSDYGYQRQPYMPKIGELVTIGLLLDECANFDCPVLKWRQDGKEMPSVIGKPFEKEGDDRAYFTFMLPAFAGRCQVDYRFAVMADGAENTSKTYTFQVLEETPLGTAMQLYKKENGAVACFEALQIELNWENGLVSRVLAVDAHHGRHAECDEISASLPDGHEISIKKHPFCWVMKRYTDILVNIAGEGISVLLNKHNQVCGLTCQAEMAGSRLTGFGERFDAIQQQGENLLLRVVEHYSNQGRYTYLPIPFFFTDARIGWFTPSARRIAVAADAFPGRITFSFETPQLGVLLEERWLTGEPAEMLMQLHAHTGAAKLPPKWALGIWMSSNGWNSQQETLEQLDALNRLALPATAMVLEAWSDEKTFYIFNDAQYDAKPSGEAYAYSDFRFSQEGKWPDPKAMAERFEKEHINLVLWQIPVIKKAWEGPNEQLLRDEAYAIERRYCVMNDDGTPYRITDNWFRGSLLLDFTNPKAAKWWFDKRAYLIDTLHIKGFKTDGGEFLFDDTACLHDGQRGNTAHNLYPNQYVGAYHAYMEEKGCDGVTFSRAGFAGAQRFPMHWAGDQLSSFKEFRAQLTAGLTAGLSGILFWTFDMGGFAGEFPSRELYLRAMALAAFSTAMQWHSEPRNGQFFLTERERWNNDRSPWNIASLYQDDSIIDYYRLYGNFRMNLMPYLYSEAVFCAKQARPLMAHLLIDYPDDANAWDCADQFMLGRSVMVAPVMEEGETDRSVYFPAGDWYDVQTGEMIKGETTLRYSCPVGGIPFFIKAGSVIPMHCNRAGIIGSKLPDGSVGNRLDRYDVLALVMVGGTELAFADDIGTGIILSNGVVKGSGIDKVLLVDALRQGEDVHLFGNGKHAYTVEVKAQ